MTESRAKSAKPRVQYAALPYRKGAEGLEILLITSRETRRWIIPKGWPMRNTKPYAVAAQEAKEEAGVTGRVGKRPLGRYAYEKRLKSGRTIPCEVEVFPLSVKRQREQWREKGQREGRWLGPDAAAELVLEPDLAALIRAFHARKLAAKAKPSTAEAPRP